MKFRISFYGHARFSERLNGDEIVPWMKRMQPARGCIHFARVIRLSCDLGEATSLFCRGYCTSGRSYSAHRPPGILAEHFFGNSRGKRVRGKSERFRCCTRNTDANEFACNES